MRTFSLSIVIFTLLASQPVQAESFLWEISHQGRMSYLLGSIHMGNKAFYPLPKAMEQAFAASKVLALEANPSKIGAALSSVMSRGMYSPPDSLQQHISAKTYTRVKNEAQKVGLPMMAIDRMRPWLLALTLTAMALQKSGYDPQLGIEMHFLKKKGARSIAELEGAEFQINLFAGFSSKEQESFLLYTLSEMTLVATQMKQMVALWKRGDVRGLGALMEASRTRRPEFRAVYDRLVIKRNISMAKTIDDMLKKTKVPHLIVVGAGHLVGKTSIVKQLERKGYTLRQR
ncbi:MAG: TraB/GumN family protein [Deltaproteobacteria bacterium]|nr:TraB/GumN family protein [Deltaproteobacteria bacterium]